MAQLDYPKLNRVQRMAVFLIVIGQETAANLVRSFADHDLEAVCREMAKHPLISDEVARAALEEFAALVEAGLNSALGGTHYVRATLELARGSHRAAYLLERVTPPMGVANGPTVAQFEGVDTRRVFSLLKGDQPQTIAFVLSQLNLTKAGELLRMLNTEKRAEVLERLGEMESTSPEVVRRIAQQFSLRSSSTTQPPLVPVPAQHCGGAEFVAGLLKTLDKETSRGLLSVLQDRNAALSEIIRKKLFSFEDVGSLSKADLQRVLREVEPADLAMALKGPRGEAMLKKVTAAMSKRAAESMEEEILLIATVRPKDQEAAQDRVLTAVRRLEEQGEITLDGGESTDAA